MIVRQKEGDANKPPSPAAWLRAVVTNTVVPLEIVPKICHMLETNVSKEIAPSKTKICAFDLRPTRYKKISSSGFWGDISRAVKHVSKREIPTKVKFVLREGGGGGGGRHERAATRQEKHNLRWIKMPRKKLAEGQHRKGGCQGHRGASRA